jgi:hypothetical protein
MTDFIYCGSPPVSRDSTRAMLTGEFHALWAPPMHRHAAPTPGDRVWLIWRDSANGELFILGGGFVEATPEGRIDWTNRTAPGIVGAARASGYGGPTNMAFLRLTRVQVPADSPTIALGGVRIGLSEAGPEQAAALLMALPIK